MTLANAHTHLEFSTRERLLPDPSCSFAEWIVRVATDNDRVPPEDYAIACEKGVIELARCGTTQVGDFSKTGGCLPYLIEYGLTGIVWIQVLGERMEKGLLKLERARRIIDLNRGRASNSSIEMGLGVHSPYSLNPNLWEPALRYAEAESLSLCIHVAESPSEWELFVRGTGPHRELEKALDLPAFPCPNMSPISYLHKLGALQFSPYLVHAVHVDDEDIDLIQKSRSRVVHCPRSNQRLECGRMPLERYVAKNVDVLIGTDSRASSPSLDVREEMEFARTLHKEVVDAKIVEEMIRRSLVSV